MTRIDQVRRKQQQAAKTSIVPSSFCFSLCLSTMAYFNFCMPCHVMLCRLLLSVADMEEVVGWCVSSPVVCEHRAWTPQRRYFFTLALPSSRSYSFTPATLSLFLSLT